jgi:hypothetical protein
MAVAEYVTKDDLEEALKPLEVRLREDMATKEYVREQADRVIEAIQRGTSPNF